MTNQLRVVFMLWLSTVLSVLAAIVVSGGMFLLAIYETLKFVLVPVTKLLAVAVSMPVLAVGLFAQWLVMRNEDTLTDDDEFEVGADADPA
jgi:hypothetical protein